MGRDATGLMTRQERRLKPELQQSLPAHRCQPQETYMRANITGSSDSSEGSDRLRVLWLSAAAFTLMFNVWLMLGVLGISIRSELGLSDAQLEWLMATTILSGALLRLNFGIWADRFGGRNVMVALLIVAAVASYLFSLATSYTALLVCAA